MDEINDNYLPIGSIIPTSEINANSLPDLQKAQQEDPIFGKLYQLIKSTGQNHKKQNRYVIHEETFYRKGITKTNITLQLCLPQNLIPEVLAKYHDHIMTGHLGQNRTLDKLTKRFYWPYMEKDNKNYIRSCTSCQMRKAVPDKPAGFMVYIEANYPFHKIGIDLLGPFPETPNNKKYIIVAVDYLTKWAETDSLPNGTAEETAQFFVKNIVLRHGAPNSIITDRGKCFIAEFTKRILDLLDVTHYKTTSYHPQTNGLCERLNHTLADMLSMYVNSDHKNWDSILPYITFAYNTSRQESTGQTPFFLLYGREATLPQDIEFKVKSNPLQIKGVSEQPEAVAKKITEARHLLLKRLHQVHLRQKADYDKKRRETNYSKDDLVLVYKPFRKVGKSDKLLHRWLGPYKIIRRISDLNYEVQKLRTRSNTTDTVHVTNLKPFNPPSENNFTREPYPKRHRENDDAKQTDDTKSRKPGRPRKNTMDTQPPTQQITIRPTRNRRPLQRLIHALFLMLLFILVASEPPVSPISDGNYFQKDRQVIFSDSEWIITTDITFASIIEHIRTLRTHLTSRAWNETHLYSRSNDITFFHSNPIMRVRAYAIQATMDSIATLNAIEQRLTESILVANLDLVEKSSKVRPNRGMINLGGDILKWVFGTASNTDLVNFHSRLQTFAQANEAIVFSIQDQATTVSENLRRTELNTKILEELHDTLEHLDAHFFNSTVGLTHSMNTMSLLNIAFLRIRRHMKEIQSHVENIAHGLSTLSLGRLPAELFSPRHLLHVLQEIDKTIPKPWNFIIPADPDNVWLLYQNIKVVTATAINYKSQKNLKLFLHVPIYERTLRFDLYNVFNKPTFNANASHDLQFENLPEHVAISSNQQKFVELEVVSRRDHARISKMYRYRISKNLPDYQSFQQSTNDPFMRNVVIQERRKQKRIMSSSFDAMERI